MYYKFVTAALIGVLTTFIAYGASSVHSKTIRRDTSSYFLDIEYPDKLGSKSLNQAMLSFVMRQKDQFIKQLKDQISKLDESPGKSTLKIRYTIPYQAYDALSVLFEVSTYFRGEAHPNTQFVSFNFINGKSVKLQDLFQKDSEYLSALSTQAREALLLKKLPEKAMIEAGTRPDKRHFNTWTFSSTGLTFIFNAYQVAPYSAGAQRIEWPLASFKRWLKPDALKAIWGE